jgi:DNA-binding CsgD family transcriptional regulator
MRHTADALGEEVRLLKLGLEVTQRGMLVLRENGSVLSITVLAERWLQQYFGWQPGQSLPLLIHQWVATRTPHAALLDRLVIDRLVIPRHGRRLVIQRIPDQEPPALVLRETAASVSPESLTALGLSPRETEVLAWMAQGKTDQDIAAILGLSVRTVHHHVARVLERLGVETRSAAAAIAHETAADA